MRVSMIRTGAGAIGALLIAMLVLPMAVAFAETAKNVTNSEEASFLAKREPLASAPGGDPTCDLPVGCNASGQAQRPNPDPEGVLVVAANAGDPDAQSYFNFDLASLGFGAVVTDGVVTLPVARDRDARNFRPEAATMVACRVTGFIPGGTDAGSFESRPEFDDKSCVEVKKSKDDPLIFTFDLERFGKVWSADPLSQMGVTIMVDPAVKPPPPAPDETWRVVFNTKRRADQKTAEDEQKPEAERQEFPAITSTLEYRIEEPDTFEIPPIGNIDGGSESGGGGGGNIPTGNPFPTSPGTSGSPSISSGSTGGGFVDPGPATTGSVGAPAAAPAGSGTIAAPQSGGAPPVDTPVAAGEAAPVAEQPAAAPAAQPISAPGTSKAVFILPLLAVAMAGLMAWSLMAPAELVPDRQGAVSRLMRTRRLQADASTPS